MKYVAGKVTVITNDSGALLNLFIGKDAHGNPITVTMHPRKGNPNIDIEEILDDDPKRIKRALYHLRALTETGRIGWHAKGSNPSPTFPPAGFQVPMVEGAVVNAPPNEYDKKLNDLLDKDLKEDEKTKAGGRRELRREVTPEPHLGPSGEDLQKRPTEPEVINKYEDLGPGAIFEIALEKGVIEKVGGGYFRFGGETLGRGQKESAEALEKNPKLLAEVKAALPS